MQFYDNELNNKTGTDFQEYLTKMTAKLISKQKNKLILYNRIK